MRDHDGVGTVVSDRVSQDSAVPVDFQTIAIGAFCCPGLQEDETDLRRRVYGISVSLSVCVCSVRGKCYEQISTGSDHRVVEHILHKSVILLSSTLDGIQRCHHV